MKVITSATVFRDVVGMRLSATYSEVDESTGRILADNKRFDRVITGEKDVKAAQDLLDFAAGSIEE